MRKFLFLFLHAFLLDAVLSVADIWLPISPVRNVVAAVTLLLGLAIYVAAAFSTRLPARFVLPPVAFLAWAGIAGGFPLAFLVPDHFETLLVGLQLLLAIGLWLAHRRWQKTPPDPFARAFSWKRLGALAALALVAAPLSLAAGAVHVFGTHLEARSGGYFKLRPAGIQLEERRFGKDGREVRLVSMMHIGEKAFYDGVQSSLPRNESAVVLVEGLTDDTRLLRNRFTYSGLARMLGLAAQESSTLQTALREPAHQPDDKPAPHLRYRHGDVDISAFDPQTVAFINAIGLILSSQSLAEAAEAVREAGPILEAPGAEEVVMHDILDKRNAHLVSEIDKALRTAQIVIVPWGALHLSDIEAALKERGFAETARTAHTAVRFFPDGRVR